MPHVQVPRHVVRLVVDYFASPGSSSTTSPTPRVRVPRLVTRLVVDYFAYVTRLVTRLLADYFIYTARPGASACRTACRAARRRLLRQCRAPGASGRRAARRRLLRLRRVFGCLSMSRGSSCGSSSTTSPTPHDRVPWHVARLVDYFASRKSPSTTSHTPRVWVPRHVAWLVVDYFAYTARPGASAYRAARRRLLRLRRVSGCVDG
jgi:hypothetical protein